MGGNASYINRNTGKILGHAERVDLNKIDRNTFVDMTFDILLYLQNKFTDRFNTVLWDENLLKKGKYYTGSTRLLFDSNISTEKFLKHKSEIGDIDIMTDVNKLERLFYILISLEGKEILPGITYLGQKLKEYKPGDPIFGIFQLEFNEEYEPINVQIDFSAVEMDGLNPPDFYRFSHVSSWIDIVNGIKSPGKNIMIRSVIKVSNLIDGIVLTDKSPEDINNYRSKRKQDQSQMIGLYTFNMVKGFRKKYYQITKNGEPLYSKDGRPFYKEILARDSEYNNNLIDLFVLMFHNEPTEEEFVKMWSFVGMVDLVEENFVRKEIELLFLIILQREMFGPKAPKFYRAEDNKDYQEKMKMIEYLYEKFPYLEKKFDNAVQFYSRRFYEIRPAIEKEYV